jgi:hypothetical protein
MDGLFCGRFSCQAGFFFCELLFVDSSIRHAFGVYLLLVCLKTSSGMSHIGFVHWCFFGRDMDEEGYVHIQNPNRFEI